MHTGEELPIAELNVSMKDVLNIVNKKKFGLCIITDKDNNLKGMITDGDIRRAIIANPDLLNKKATDIIKGNPFTVKEDILATEALKLLEDNQITSLIVVDYKNKIKGLLHLHDLWRTEMI
jgi:arabinose-5-phosphate isomerase